MSDISNEKIKELLSDPKTVERIASLVGSMGGGGLSALLGSTVAPSQAKADLLPQESDSPAALPREQASETVMDEKEAFAPTAVPFSENFGRKGDDRRVTLLKAIRPYVSDAKKERVDGLVRAINVAGLLNNYKNGLLG